MKKLTICIGMLALVAGCGDSGEDDSEMQVTGYTVPPLDDDPPLGGSDIDAIDREMRERTKTAE